MGFLQGSQVTFCPRTQTQDTVYPSYIIEYDKAEITYLLNASLRITIFSCLNVLSILISRLVVFLTISSSSIDSLNFLIATILGQSDFYCDSLTMLSIFLVLGLVHNSVGTFSDDADGFIFVHCIYNLIQIIV